MRQNRTLWLSVGLAGGMAAVALYQWKRRGNDGGFDQAAHPDGNRSRHSIWRFDSVSRILPAGKLLRFELSSPGVVHWTTDQWDHAQDTKTTHVATSLNVADLPTEGLAPGTRIQFTFYWPEVNRWEGEDFELVVEEAAQHAT